MRLSEVKSMENCSIEAYKENFVLLLAENNCIERNRKLQSGRISPLYFNFGGELYNGKSFGRIAEYYAHALYASFSINDKTVIFGPAMKGIPLVTAIALECHHLFGNALRFTGNRQIAKDHGEGGLLLGDIKKGDKIIIIDDVFTTGETKKQTRDLLLNEKEGITIDGVLIGIDRKELEEEGGYNAVEIFSSDTNIPVRSVITIDDVITVMKKKGILTPDWEEDIRKYRAQYGC